MTATTVRPDYHGGGILNLVQSLASGCGSRSAAYPPLALLPAERVAAARHVVLLVVDGLGQKTLDTHLAHSRLRRHQLGTLTSVFPSTTASAITTFMTGLAPAQHALTGWHIHFAELERTLAILPLTPRDGLPLPRSAELPPRLFGYPSLYQQLARESWVLAPQHIAGTPFNAWHARGATTLAYASLPEMFVQLAGLLDAAAPPRFIYVYHAELDQVSHRHGVDSEQVQQLLAVLDRSFARFANMVSGSDTLLLLTADHGFIDSPPEREVCLDAHPQLAALLVRPLCGERRAAYAYVAPENAPAFAEYVGRHLAHCVDLRRSAELVFDGWFGPPPFNPRLAARVGDYTLLMRENWTIKDWLPAEKRYSMLGVHGGVSADEMRVPLLAVEL